LTKNLITAVILIVNLILFCETLAPLFAPVVEVLFKKEQSIVPEKIIESL